MDKKRIMFVCMGNICRSPLAHGIFQKLVDDRNLSDHFFIESSGTTGYHVGELPDQRMTKTALNHGFDLNHRARRFSHHDLEEYDLVLAMDRDNLSDIHHIGRDINDLSHVKLFRDFDPQGYEGSEVPDPYYGGQEGFENVFNIVLRTSEKLLDELEQERGI